MLRDASCWANLRSADHLRHQAVRLPLPRSNTPAAKQMRIAAVLAALSRSLARHVFRPTWAVEGVASSSGAGGSGDNADAALGALLRGLEAASPDHERHLRGALLAAAAAVHHPAARGGEAKKEEGEGEEEEEGGQARVPHGGPWRRRAAAVVREVTFLVQHLLSALQYGAFREGLEACVALACGRWAEVQGAAMKVEPYFGPPYDDFDWQVLTLPEGFRDGEGPLGGGRGGGSTLGLDAGSGTIGGSPRGLPPPAAAAPDAAVPAPSRPPPSPPAPHDNEDDASSTIAESARSVVDPADIMLVLWPTMCAVEGGELVSITQGLVMAKEQATAAFEEEGRRRRRPAGANGKRARSMSQSRSGAAPAGKPHSGKAILAQAKRERERDDGSAGGSGGGSRNASRNGSLAAVD